MPINVNIKTRPGRKDYVPLARAFSMAASATAAIGHPGVLVANLSAGHSLPLESLTNACDCMP